MVLLPFVAGFLVLISLAGCANQELHPSNNIRTIQIQETVEPSLLRAQVGDEIRWDNLSGRVVRVGFLGTLNSETVTCEKGFRWMGFMQDSATIKPNESVSLCFSKPSTIRFNVWMDWNNSRTNISPTSTVLVEQVG